MEMYFIAYLYTNRQYENAMAERWKKDEEYETC